MEVEQFTKLLSDRLMRALGNDAELEERKTLGAIGSIHIASKARILTVVDKLVASELPTDVPLQDVPDERNIPIPYREKWGLEVGDKVEVNRDLPEFRAISQKTVGWKPVYEKALGKVGYVTSICSPYDCHVQVLFPEIPILAEIYAGLLSKTDNIPRHPKMTRFQSGDGVIIKAPHTIVKLLQTGYDEIPDRYLGKHGRVIAVDCEKAVHVTFCGTLTVRVNSALLQREYGELEIATFKNSKGIIQNDEVVVTKQLKKFIGAQKKIKDWEGWMSSLPGKTLRVLLVKNNDLLRVCNIAGRSFHVLTEVVSKRGAEPEDESNDGEKMYEVGEWVALKKTKNISKIILEKNIPISLLEYLQKPAKLNSYDEDLEPGITFDSVYTITVPYSALEAVTDAEKEEAGRIEEAARNLKRGDEVLLNLGPPNYVRHVLHEHGYPTSIAEMVTSKAILKGFVGSKHGIVECSDGVLRKIKRVYLTVPEKFRLPKKGKLSCDLSQINGIVSILEKCLEDLNTEKTTPGTQIESGIKNMSIEKGEPSTIWLGIRSHLVDATNVKDALLRCPSMRFEALSEDMLHIYEVNETPVDLLVHLDFDSTPAFKSLASNKKKVEQRDSEGLKYGDKGKAYTEENHFQETPGPVGAKARPGPTQEQAAGEEPTQHNAIAGYQRHMDLDLNGTRVQIPYRIPERQRPDPNGSQDRREREESAAGPFTRITIAGELRDVCIQ